MEKLNFYRQKYGKELLIDACHTSELKIAGDTLVLSFYSLIVLKQGSGIHTLDNEEIELGKDMVLFVRPGQINFIPKAVYEMGYFLFFEGDFLDEFFSDKHFIYKFGFYHNLNSPSYLRLEPEEFDKYFKVSEEIRLEIKQLNQDSDHVLRSLIYYLLVRLNQHYGSAYQLRQDTLMEPKLLKFITLLEKHVRKQLRVEEYAQKLKISRVHLNTLCQKYFSKTSQQVIREFTIAEIKKSIRYENKSLSEIAYDFNFTAPSHFTRFFKQMTDQSPQAFRKQLSNW